MILIDKVINLAIFKLKEGKYFMAIFMEGGFSAGSQGYSRAQSKFGRLKIPIPVANGQEHYGISPYRTPGKSKNPCWPFGQLRPKRRGILFHNKTYTRRLNHELIYFN